MKCKRLHFGAFSSILTMASLFGLASPGGAQDAKPEDASQQAIRKVLDDQVTAWNRGDLAGFMNGYWKSPEMTFSSGGTTIQGWQAAFSRYKARYQTEGHEMGKLAFIQLSVVMLGPDAAFVRGGFELKTAKESPKGIFTLVFRRFSDGWKIVHDHTSGPS
jgi:ketosteroid isomerase-like protein